MSSFFHNLSRLFTREPAGPTPRQEPTQPDENQSDVQNNFEQTQGQGEVPASPIPKGEVPTSPIPKGGVVQNDQIPKPQDDLKTDDSFLMRPATSTPIVKFHDVTTKKIPVRREKDPMKYNGRTDWGDYLGHFSAVAEWNNWNNTEMGLQLAISLTDEAREVMGSLPKTDQHQYQILIDTLTRRFSPEGRESQYSLELMNRVCSAEEDVASYGHTLRRAANKAYPGQRLDEKILVDLYIKGLPNKDMKRHVYLAKPKTLADAINFAVAYEAFENPNSPNVEKPKKPKPNVCATQAQKNTQNDTSQNDIDKLTQAVAKMSDSMTEMGKQMTKMTNFRNKNSSENRKSNVECYKCHQKGHYARECTTEANQNNSSIPENATSANSASNNNHLNSQ